MPSEDSKPQEDGDEMCIGSLLTNRKKKPSNNSNGVRPKKEASISNVKKEDSDSDYDDDEPIGKQKKTLNKVVKKEAQPKVVKKEAQPKVVKKEEYEEPKDVKKTPNKTDKVKKKVKEEEKKSAGKVVEQNNGKKREKKVYDLPGQKRDPPEERDPLRIFYESLYEQEPNSEMAAFWMMECGLLPKDKAAKVYEKKLKRNQQQKLGSPMKSVVTVKKSSESNTVKKKVVTSSSTSKKKTPESKGATKASKKRKADDDESGDGSDDDFEMPARSIKKQRGA